MDHKLRISLLSLMCFLAFCSSQRYVGDSCTDSRRRNGVCQNVGQCPIVQEELRKGIRPTNCGFVSGQPVVCCPRGVQASPPITTAPPTRATTSPPRKSGERAKYWCGEYNKMCPVPLGVVGGTPALPGEFPHMAAVGYGQRNNIQWKCGGSLISDKFVLTAAHCLRAGRDGPAQWVLLGGVSLAPNATTPEENGQIHPVVRRIRHPEYRPPAKYNDVALLEIGSAISGKPLSLLSKELHPVCLRTSQNLDNKVLVATGWGRVGFGEDPSLELLKVQLNVYDEAKCNETFDTEIRTTNQLRKGIDSTMVCAGVLEGGKDTCQGDSGGPLQFNYLGSCRHELWGITSFGKTCSFPNSPSVYMRVSAFIEWIEDIVWP